MQVLQKYWRDRAYEIYLIIKAKGIPISRGWPIEMLGAFLGYFTRQELLNSYHSGSLMDLLQEDYSPKPYVILDDDLGVKRIGNMLRMPTREAEELVPIFFDPFKKLAPSQVFLNESEFIKTIVEPRVIEALRSSGELRNACLAMGTDHVYFASDTWEDTEDLYLKLPRGVPTGPEDLIKLRKLRDDKKKIWTYCQLFQVFPTNETENQRNENFESFCKVRIDFQKLDRAILAAGEYSVKIHVFVARKLSPAGHYDTILDFDSDISIVI